MTKNMGTIDRLIRTCVAVIIAALLLSGVITSTLAVILGIFAVMFLGTSAIGWCPLYKPMRVSTKKASEKSDG
jgi:chromate transport protein ChrA